MISYYRGCPQLLYTTVNQFSGGGTFGNDAIMGASHHSVLLSHAADATVLSLNHNTRYYPMMGQQEDFRRLAN